MMAKKSAQKELQEGIIIKQYRNVYNNYCTVVKIPLPEIDDEYPLSELSNFKLDFEKAGKQFPILNRQFQYLNKMKQLKTKFPTMCLLRTKEQNYIQVNFECCFAEKDLIGLALLDF